MNEIEERILGLIERFPGIRTAEIRHLLDTRPGVASLICTHLRRRGAITLTRKGGWTVVED
jgi:hypothetical protein